MDRRNRSRLDAARRVFAFSRQHQAEIVGYVEALKGLGDGLDRADRLAAQQAVGDNEAHASVARKSELRGIIVEDHLAHFVRIAHVSLPQDPELKKLFTLPGPKVSREAFVAGARATLAAAAERKELFIREGMPETFVEDVEQLLTRYLEANDEKSVQEALRIGAVADLKAVTDTLMAVVKRLDGINQKRWARDPELLAAWKSAKDIRRSAAPKPVQGSGGTGATT